MKILITGTSGLASSLMQVLFNEHEVMCVSRVTGHDINNVDHWGHEFLDFDMIFNCAYSGFAQVKVLEFFFDHWKNNPNKIIVSIGSRAITHKRIENSDEYWPYRIHKQALQSAHDSMLLTAKCDLKIFNPGPIDTKMIAHLSCNKESPDLLAKKIKQLTTDKSLKRIDLWE